MQSQALDLLEVRVEVTSMSPIFPDDRKSVQSIIGSLYKDARAGKVRYGFINRLKRELRALGFVV